MGDAEGERSRGSALEKALLVLDTITKQPQSIGLPDIASGAGLPRQTAHRVLQQLERSGLVARDVARDRFLVGPRLSQLALAALYSENQSAPVRGILTRLVDDVQETCKIGILRGMQFVAVERVECKQPLRIQLESPFAPAHCTAGGKAQLAYMPAEMRARLLRSAKLKAETSRSVTDPGQLEQELAEIRRKGYAVCVEELADGLTAVGVPILDRAGRPRAALTVHGPLVRLPESRAAAFAPRMKQTVEELATLWELDKSG